MTIDRFFPLNDEKKWSDKPPENSPPPNSGGGSRGSEHFYKEQLRPSPPRQYCSRPEYLSRLLLFRRRPLPSDLCRSAVSAPMDLI